MHERLDTKPAGERWRGVDATRDQDGAKVAPDLDAPACKKSARRCTCILDGAGRRALQPRQGSLQQQTDQTRAAHLYSASS